MAASFVGDAKRPIRRRYAGELPGRTRMEPLAPHDPRMLPPAPPRPLRLKFRHRSVARQLGGLKSSEGSLLPAAVV
jgi:hypothetical protein